MLSEMVCSGTRQKLRTTRGGTTAAPVTKIQLGTDLMPIAIAATKTAIDQAMNSSVFVFSENMETSVPTGSGVRCSELHVPAWRSPGV